MTSSENGLPNKMRPKLSHLRELFELWASTYSFWQRIKCKRTFPWQWSNGARRKKERKKERSRSLISGFLRTPFSGKSGLPVCQRILLFGQYFCDLPLPSKPYQCWTCLFRLLLQMPNAIWKPWSSYDAVSESAAKGGRRGKPDEQRKSGRKKSVAF